MVGRLAYSRGQGTMLGVYVYRYVLCVFLFVCVSCALWCVCMVMPVCGTSPGYDGTYFKCGARVHIQTHTHTKLVCSLT